MESDRTERLAVSLIDLDYLDPAFRQKVFSGRLDLRNPIIIEERGAKTIVIGLLCDLLTAALACDIIRNESRREGDVPIRVYLWRDGGQGWVRLPPDGVLTVLHDGIAFLNHDWFPIDVRPEDLVPPTLMPVQLGASNGAEDLQVPDATRSP